MQFSRQKLAFVTFAIAFFGIAASAQELTRDLNLAGQSDVTVVNHFGRVTAQAKPAAKGQKVSGKLTAASIKGVSEKEVRMSGAGGRVVIDIVPADTRKRIDLNLVLPERSRLRIETLTGAVELSGNFSFIEAKTETGTIAADVPAEDLTYHFTWTESHPRY